MNSKGATPTQVYEDFVPSSKLDQEEHLDTIHLNLQGFKKEQLRVILPSTRILKISGQRPIGPNKWQRFQNEFPVAENCDRTKISAIFENGILLVKQPKLTTSSVKDKELSSTLVENAPAAKTQKTTLRDEFSKLDNADIDTPAKEEPKKTSEQAEAKSIAEKKLPSDELNKHENVKQEQPKQDNKKEELDDELNKHENVKQEQPKQDNKKEEPDDELNKHDNAKQEQPKQDNKKEKLDDELNKHENVKQEQSKQDNKKEEPDDELNKHDNAKQEQPKNHEQKHDVTRDESQKDATSRSTSGLIAKLKMSTKVMYIALATLLVLGVGGYVIKVMRSSKKAKE